MQKLAENGRLSLRRKMPGELCACSSWFPVLNLVFFFSSRTEEWNYARLSDIRCTKQKYATGCRRVSRALMERAVDSYIRTTTYVESYLHFTYLS